MSGEQQSNNPSTVTDDSVLAAIVAGDRTEQQLAARFGITLHPVYPTEALHRALNALVCADLLCMRVVDRQWHYLPTRKGRQKVVAGLKLGSRR